MSRKPRFYQPTITRLPSLSCLLLFTLAGIALIELACRRLPVLESKGIISKVKEAEKIGARRRDAVAAPQDGALSTIPVVEAPEGALSTTPVLASTPAAEAYLPLDPTTDAAAPSAYLPIDGETTISTPLEPATTVDGASATAQYADPSAYLPVIPSPSPTIAASAASTNYLPIGPTDSVVNIPGQSASPPVSAYLPIITTIAGAGLGSDDLGPTFSITAGSNYLPIHGSNGPTVVGAPPSVISAYAGSDQQAIPTKTGVVDGMQYSIVGGLLYIDGKTVNRAVPTAITLDGGDILAVDATGAVSVQMSSNDTSMDKPGKAGHPAHVKGVTTRQYIIGAFVPTILAVLFSIPWHLLASALEEMEPFYQLQRPGGVAASKSLLLDYKNSINVIATINAIGRGHFLVWWSGLISLVVLGLAPLASETVFIGFIGPGVCTATSGRSACTPRLSVYPVAARVLQGILALVAVLTVALAVALARRKSGVYTNPLSIASVAALFQNQYLINEFRRLNPYVTDQRTLAAAFEGQTYKIGPYEEYYGRSSYGLMLCQHNSVTQEDDGRTQNRDGKKYASVAVTAVDENPPPRPKTKMTSAHFLTRPASVVVYGLLVAGMEALVVYYNQTGGDTPFERFMDSESFGVTFLFTAVGVGVKMYWTLLDDEIRAMEPYRQLLRGNAPASDSILLSPHSNPFTGFFYSLRNGHFFNAYISFVAILCEPLIVAFSNIPFKAGLAFIAYRVCTYITIGILSLMLIGIMWMLCRKGTPGFAANKPDTLAGLMVALCGSHMLEGFAGMSELEREDRDDIVKGWGKGYSMGTLVGVDGVERDGIDEGIFVGNTRRTYASGSEFM